MNSFIRQHFDKLLLSVIFAALLISYLCFQIDGLFQLLRDVTVAIITLAGAAGVRRLADTQNTVEKIEAETLNVTPTQTEKEV